MVMVITPLASSSKVTSTSRTPEARTLLHGYFRPNTQLTAVETHGYPKYLLAVDINIDQVLPSEVIIIDEDGWCDVECFV